MRVISVDRAELLRLSAELARLVSEAGFSPDVIAGIRTGGAEVALPLSTVFPEAAVGFLSACRPGKKNKERLGGILPRLPLWLLDMMRKAEWWLTMRRTRQGVRDLDLSLGKVPAARASEPGARILVVDDAVDTGSTMRLVCEGLARLYPSADIRTAALTVTTSEPLHSPDFALYRNHTLIRFPWAADSRH